MGTRIIPISIYSFPPLPILKLESYSHSHGTLMGIPFPPGIPLPWLSLICTSHISITVQMTVRALYSTNGVAVGCPGCPRCAPKFRQGEGCLFVLHADEGQKEVVSESLHTLPPCNLATPLCSVCAPGGRRYQFETVNSRQIYLHTGCVEKVSCCTERSRNWKLATLILFVWLNILCYTVLWRHVYFN